MLNHAMQHLSSYNNRLLSLNTLTNQLSLNQRNLFLTDLDSQVATCYHYAIDVLKNFVDILNTFLIFNLGNNLYRTIVLIKNLLYCLHIVSIANKGVSNEINVFFNTKLNELYITFCKRRKVDANTWDINTLLTTKSTVIQNFAFKHSICNIPYYKVNLTIVEKEVAVNTYILSNIWIGDTDDFLVTLARWISLNIYDVTHFQNNVVVATGSPDFWTLCIHQQSNLLRYLADIVYNTLQPLEVDMGSIHTYYIHASFV